MLVSPAICDYSTNLDLRFSLALCEKEKQFRLTRRERVMLGIKKLLYMEKPRFLPSSPEEVGWAAVLHSTTCNQRQIVDAGSVYKTVKDSPAHHNTS